ALRGALCDDAGRAAAEHRQRSLFHVRRRLQVVEPRQRFGGGIPAVPVDLCRDGNAALARAATRRRCWSPPLRRTPAQWAVNGALLGLTVVTLFPLVWMVAVSLMTPGEASTYPPPLV